MTNDSPRPILFIPQQPTMMRDSIVGKHRCTKTILSPELIQEPTQSGLIHLFISDLITKHFLKDELNKKLFLNKCFGIYSF